MSANEPSDLIFSIGDVLMGVATCAVQIEGGDRNNNWYDWAQQPGTIKDGSIPERATDHWRRWREDTDLMAQLVRAVLRNFAEAHCRAYDLIHEIQPESVGFAHRMRVFEPLGPVVRGHHRAPRPHPRGVRGVRRAPAVQGARRRACVNRRTRSGYRSCEPNMCARSDECEYWVSTRV